MKRKFLRLIAGVVAAGMMILSAFAASAAGYSAYALDDPALQEMRENNAQLDELLTDKSKEQQKSIENALERVKGEIVIDPQTGKITSINAKELKKEADRQAFLAAASQPQVFDDVAPDMWHFPYIMTLYNKGGVSGIGNGCFDPDANVTAAEFFAIAARLVMPDKIDMSSAEECWAFPYFDAMVAENIILPPGEHYSEWARDMEDVYWTEPIPDYNGYVYAGPAHYSSWGLGNALDRYKMAELLVKLAWYRGERMYKIEGIENNIDDSAKCVPEIFEAYSAGLVTGKGDGNFDPYGKMTRAEMCVVFCRLMNYIPREEVVVQAQKQDEYIVTVAGPMKGKLKPEVARKYNLEALSKMYVKEDENGVYLTVTAPELPDELADCTFDYHESGVNSLDNYFYEFPEFLRYPLKPGETRSGYLIHYDTEGPVRSSEIAYMEFGVEILTPDYGYTLYHQADTSSKELVLEHWYNDHYEAISADVSHIFAGIGK